MFFSKGLILTCALLWGLLWGAFTNVVIHRLPRGISVVYPRSFCPACERSLAWYDIIPIVSYVGLQGKARCCGARISSRYLWTELLGGVLSVAIVQVFILLSLRGLDPFHAAALYLSHFSIALGLVAAAWIDMEYMFLPDSITLGGTFLACATASVRQLPFSDALGGALFGFVVVYGPFIFLYSKVRGQQGMGMGDAKLMMLLGAWLGWQGALFSLFAASIQGLLLTALWYGMHRKIEEPAAVRAERETLKLAANAGNQQAQEILKADPLGSEPQGGLRYARVPFGPFLILSSFEYLFFFYPFKSSFSLVFPFSGMNG